MSGGQPGLIPPTPLTPLAIPEIHSLLVPSGFLALAESTISALYVSGLTKLATSADCP
jgi:hypothetical protein